MSCGKAQEVTVALMAGNHFEMTAVVWKGCELLGNRPELVVCGRKQWRVNQRAARNGENGSRRVPKRQREKSER